MNQSVAKLSLTSLNKIKGELLPPFNEGINDYFDLWGFKNFGKGRLLTKEGVARFTNTPLSQLSAAPPLYGDHPPSERSLS